MQEASVAARGVMSKLLPQKPPTNVASSEGYSSVANGNGQDPSADSARAATSGVTFPQPTYTHPSYT